MHVLEDTKAGRYKIKHTTSLLLYDMGMESALG